MGETQEAIARVRNAIEGDGMLVGTDVAVLLAEHKRLCKTLNTAYLMVKVDATDAPGRISTAIRPFLEAAVARAEGARSDG